MRAAPLLALALLLLAFVAPAGAHTPSSPMAVSLELARSRVRVDVRFAIERGEDARALREQFDRDTDGRLADDERAALADYLATRAAGALALTVAGHAVELRRETLTADVEAGAEARVAVVVTLVGELTWPPGASEVRVAVELADARAVTPVAVRLAKKSGLSVAKDYRGGDASRGAPLVFTVTRR